MKNVLITGANGFIGKAITLNLADQEGYKVRAAVRKTCNLFPQSVEVHENLELSESTDWSQALRDIDIVVHCAARVHLLNDKSKNPVADFIKINTKGTLNLAEQSALAGVKRFIFISSLGVNGAETLEHPFRADDIPMPHSPYAQSKMEAELGLLRLSQTTKMSTVIIRPPLVYGPQAPGNFASLMKVVKRQIPLPLGAVKNKRSFVFLDNLVDLINCCLTHPNADNQIFFGFR